MWYLFVFGYVLPTVYFVYTGYVGIKKDLRENSPPAVGTVILFILLSFTPVVNLCLIIAYVIEILIKRIKPFLGKSITEVFPPKEDKND